MNAVGHHPRDSLLPARHLPGYLGTAGLRVDGTDRVQPTCVLVDLDGAAPPPSEVMALQVGPPVILVGVALRPLSAAASRLARKLTCTFAPSTEDVRPEQVGVADPLGAAAAFRDTVARHPQAAMALAALLRMPSELPVADALGVESSVYSMLLASADFAHWLATRRPPRPQAPATRPAIRTTRHADTLDVLIDRPHRHNAFDRHVRDGLVEAFDIAIADPLVRRVTLRGAGPSFCSGGDLTEFGECSDVSTAHLIRLDRSVAARVHQCRERVVAHLHGACIGAGIEIAAFAGHVVARKDAYFQLPELRMGLIPGAGGTVGVSRRIGPWRTAYLGISGVRLDAPTALAWGLVDALVPA